MKIRIKKEYVKWGIVVVILAGLGALAYIYRQPLGEVATPNQEEIAINILGEENQEPVSGNLDVVGLEPQILIGEDVASEDVAPKVYEEIAESGEGITHLARKAMKRYFADKEESPDLTPEHRIYIEDYLQNYHGDRWLQLGEKVAFSSELIEEAVQESLELSEEQLDNLTQFTSGLE